MRARWFAHTLQESGCWAKVTVLPEGLATFLDASGSAAAAEDGTSEVEAVDPAVVAENLMATGKVGVELVALYKSKSDEFVQ